MLDPTHVRVPARELGLHVARNKTARRRAAADREGGGDVCIARPASFTVVEDCATSVGMARTPLRVAVVGIDGAGKSSTTLRAIDLLARDRKVCKPGRDAFVQDACGRRDFLPRLSRGFEGLFRRADASRDRRWIGATRVAFIGYQGWLEPRMIARAEPDVVLATRCMIVDPAIYCTFYEPRLGRLGLPARLRLFRRLSRLPYRDLYILLRTLAGVAIERIHGRIAKTPGCDREPRDYWLHLHERPDVLERIDEAFTEVLAYVPTVAPVEVLEIDTTRHGEVEVAGIIAAAVRARLGGEQGSPCA